MPFDDLVKGLQMFQGGLQNLAISTGIKQATDNVEAINNSVMDQTQQRQAKAQLATQLTGNLAALGADPNQIAAARSAVAPPAIANANDAYQQAVATGDAGLMKQAKDMQSFENKNAMDLQGSKNAGEANVANIKGKYEVEAANARNSKQQKEDLLKVSKGFNVASKDAITSLDGIDNMQTMLSSKNPIGDSAIISNLARNIGNEKGKIPIAEMANYTGDTSLLGKIERAANQQTTGLRFDAKDRVAIAEILTKVKAAKENALQDLMYQHAGQAFLAGAAPSEQEAAKLLAGGNKRLQGLFRTDSQSAGAAAAAQVNGTPKGTPVTVRDKSTGKLIQALKMPDGTLVPQ